MPPSRTVVDSATSATAPPVQRAPRRTRRTTLVLGLVGCRRPARAGGLLLSIAVGSKQIPLATVLDALRHYDESNTDHVIVHSLRVPRTVIGLLVGAALGLSGALMQGVTRNPLADPGILGVNGGAALFVVGASTGSG